MEGVLVRISQQRGCEYLDMNCQISSIRCTKSQNLNVSRLVLQLSLCNLLKSQVVSREWRCSWSSADRRCSNYIWVINNFIACYGVTYIRGLMVVGFKFIVNCVMLYMLTLLMLEYEYLALGVNTCTMPAEGLSPKVARASSGMVLVVSVLSKVIKAASPNAPSMVARWVVRVTFGWSIHDVVRNYNETAILLCVIYFQPVPTRHEIYISSFPIALKSDMRLCSNSAKLPLSYFKVNDQSILRHNRTASRLQDILR